jgi:hypothetical protein
MDPQHCKKYCITFPCPSPHPSHHSKIRRSILSFDASLRAMLHPTELRCTLLSYATPSWAKLHHSELCCTLLSYAALCWTTLHLTKLCCTLLSHTAATLHPIWATLHPKSYAAPSELSCTLLSYAAHFWATLRPSELCCTILSYAGSYNWATLQHLKLSSFPRPPPAIAASLFLPAKLILYRENPPEITVSEKIHESAVQLCYCHIYHILSPDPCPTHRSYADSSGEYYIEKTPRKFQFGKKSAKVYHCLCSSTEQLQIALWT